MNDHVTWDSPGGWAEFAPPCACTHPLAAHNQHTKARACSVWSGFGVYVAPVKCPCKKYQTGPRSTSRRGFLMPSTIDSLLARIERCGGCGTWRYWLDRYPCTICIEYWKDK